MAKPDIKVNNLKAAGEEIPDDTIHTERDIQDEIHHLEKQESGVHLQPPHPEKPKTPNVGELHMDEDTTNLQISKT